jgi:hypothetical protein
MSEIGKNGLTPEEAAIVKNGIEFTGEDGRPLMRGTAEWRAALDAWVVARRAKAAADAEGFVDKVLMSRPVSAVTKRAIAIVMKHARDERVRAQQEFDATLGRINAEQQATMNQLGADAAATEGIDLGMFQLHVPGDVDPYWKPR